MQAQHISPQRENKAVSKDAKTRKYSIGFAGRYLHRDFEANGTD